MFKRLASAWVVLAGLVAADDEESDVVTLTTDNFDEIVGGAERIVVEFYAPWCGHCKALAPEYEKAATQLKTDGSSTLLAKVDATEEKDLASKFGVRGYPTLKYFVGGDTENPTDYGGGRTADTIVSWVQSRELPAVSELEDDAALQAFVDKQGVALIAITNDEGKIAVLTALADTLRDDVATGLVRNDADTLAMYRNFDGEEPVLNFAGDEFTADAITEFVNSARFPLFGEINQQNFGGYMDRGLPLAWVALDPSDEEEFKAVQAAVVGSGAAASVAGKVSIVYIDNSKYAKHVENIGIDNVPGMIVINENDKWKFSGDIKSESEVSSFFTKWAAGEIEKFLKSEAIPEDPLDEGVYVLVGQSFEDVVNSDKDVFVEFYAPWCGHCKKLAPDYVKVAAAFADVSNVVIAKIDATANDTPEPIQGFPTLIFYPKGKGAGEGVKYEGARTAKAIVEWIEERASGDVASVNKDEL